MKTICFAPMGVTAWTEMIPLALALKDQGLARPVMLILQSRTEDREEDCARAGLDHRRLQVDRRLIARMGWSGGPGATTVWARTRERLAGRLFPAILARAETARWRRLLLAQLAQARLALSELAPHSLVISDGRMPNWELPLLGACRELGIPTILPPVALAGDRDTLTRRRRGPLHHGGLHPRLLRDHPGQAVWDPKQQRHVLYYSSRVLPALASLGLLPPNPWLLGGGLADLVLVESERVHGQRLEQGQDPRRILVTGHPGHDALFSGYARRDELRRELALSYGLRAESPLAVVALPQLGEQGTLDWDSHWREIRFLGQTFRDLPAEFLVSLHPKMDANRYLFLEEEYGLRLARERLSAILPAADLFLATYSSTVHWATLCRVPALVFDFYQIDFRLFDDLPGVVTVTDRKTLAAEAEKILRDAGRRATLGRAQGESARLLSPFDGRCGERILRALLETRG